MILFWILESLGIVFLAMMAVAIYRLPLESNLPYGLMAIAMCLCTGAGAHLQIMHPDSSDVMLVPGAGLAIPIALLFVLTADRMFKS